MKIEEPIAEFSPVPQGERCEDCVGVGTLYRHYTDGRVVGLECWICEGSGKARLSPPPMPKPNPNPVTIDSDPLPWAGYVEWAQEEARKPY